MDRRGDCRKTSKMFFKVFKAILLQHLFLVQYFQNQHLHVQQKPLKRSFNVNTTGNHLDILRGISKKCNKNAQTFQLVPLTSLLTVFSRKLCKAFPAERERLKANSLVHCTVHCTWIHI